MTGPRARVLIVDDEAPARALLRSLLDAHPRIAIVGEAPGGAAAVEMIRRLDPDLVLLDVQMPEVDGFGVVEAVGPDRMPAVVFVTAHDSHAVRAFEVNAVDYVLKPYDRERIRLAVERALDRVQGRAAASEALRTLLAASRPPRLADRIPVRERHRIVLVDTADVEWIEAQDKLVRIHAAGAVHETRTTISALEKELDPERFLRVHRSAIVNVMHVRQLEPWFNGEYVIILSSGAKVRSGRAFAANVRRLTGGAG
jgi:two-component system, LytTR family, response regulator